MPKPEAKGITVRVDAGLHAEIRAYLEASGMTMGEFIAMAARDELHPKTPEMEGNRMERENMRTLAFQVPESLFQRIKDYLARNNMTQKAFVLGLIEDEAHYFEGEPSESFEEDFAPEFTEDIFEFDSYPGIDEGHPNHGYVEGELGAAIEVAIAEVNATFGTRLDPDDFSAIMNYASHQLVEIARSQLGNVGGEPYWSWYGFGSRVEWCACFVSWCANQCGYIDRGIIPKFSGCGDGVNWFMARNQWLDGSAMPEPGNIIFFDWVEDGVQDGSSDHVGIVEKVEGGRVYTIEGNSGDACQQNSYPVGYYEILGYGTPRLF